VLLKTSGPDQLIVPSQGQGMWVCTIDTRKLDSLNFKKFELPAGQGGFKNLIGVHSGSDHIWAASLTSGIMGIPIDKRRGIMKDAPVIIFHPDLKDPNTITGGGTTVETGDGHLFVSSLDNGLNKIALSVEYGKENSVTRYLHNPNDSNSVIDNGIIDLILQEDNSLLVATQGGLDIFKEGKFLHILKNISCTRIVGDSDGTLLVGTKNGLYEGKKTGGNYSFIKAPIPGDPFITSIREDRLGRVWFMSYDGLYFYDRRTKQSLLFKKDDGLPSSRSISGCGSAYTSDGIMIFGNAEGITFFNPLSLHINDASPKPLITKLKINNKIAELKNRGDDNKDFVLPANINTLRELTLDYTQNIITLEFSAMDLTAPERNLYSYQLVNFDKDSVLTDWKNRTATYTNLRPGDYTFIVKASNRDGIWNEKQTELIIHVLPPPWKTWWAYSLYGIAIAGLLFLARRNIIKQERLASKLALEHVELEKVQEIDRAKTNFFANISHEFRTPLTLIQGPVQDLMEKFKTDTQVKDQLTLVQQNSDRLLRLVNQILELARLESGTLKNEMSQSDIILFLKKIVGSFTSFAFQKKISFIQQFPDYGIRAQFDKDKLEKITSNLISNALKFTPEQGAVIVNVSVTRSNGAGELLLRVTDTGKGVPEDQMTKIFERFYQVSEDGNINVGTGIGLALCKELAEFLGGSLRLESKVGEGSRFSLALPLETAELISETQIDESDAILSNRHEVAANIVTENEDQLEKPLVLIVEDHFDLRKFIISCLGTEYSFVEASNGKEGFHHAIEQVPTLVLSDVMMPEMDGIEMCNKIKQDQRTSHIPVILLTAKASDESKLSGLGIGADDYIIKPFNKEELKLKIRNQVSARTRMQERIRMEFLSESTTIRAVSADEKFLERLKKIVETRIGDELLSVESLTEEIGMSRAQLYRKVTALTGLSGNEFIRKLRLQRAAQLLQQRVGPVSQVAYEVGFSNLSYFSKCFKEQFGVLPSEYTARVG
jgi:signal transduction histidine kinase/DNA-binding response OmpR family regulator